MSAGLRFAAELLIRYSRAVDGDPPAPLEVPEDVRAPFEAWCAERGLDPRDGDGPAALFAAHELARGS